MVEMSVAGIALDAASRSPIVLLRDPSGRRQVPIWIDQAQAQNILAGLRIKELRGLSHDGHPAGRWRPRAQQGGDSGIEDSTFLAVTEAQR